MHPDKAKVIARAKCDRCPAVCGLHMYGEGWRCPTCIWKERTDLIEKARCILATPDYTAKWCRENETHVVILRQDLDELQEIVDAITSP